MAWYAIYRKSTGELVSETSYAEKITDPLPDDLAVKEFEGGRPNFDAVEWDPVSFTTRTRAVAATDALLEKPSDRWTPTDLADGLKRALGKA